MQVMAASNVAGTHMSGTLVMFQEQQKVVHQNTSVMVLSVSGDSLMAITNLVAHKAHERPLALDLLWSVSALACQGSVSINATTCAVALEHNVQV